MGMNRIQFQPGLPLGQFEETLETEEKCESPSQIRGAPATTALPSVIQMLREADAEARAQAAGAHDPRGLSPQPIEALSAPLNRAHLSSREQGKAV